MTRIIIEGLIDRASLLAALSVVLETFNEDGAYEVEEQVFTPDVVDLPSPAPAPSLSDYGLAWAARFVPCPRRGSHDRLIDCAICWADVVTQGVLLEGEALSREAERVNLNSAQGGKPAGPHRHARPQKAIACKRLAGSVKHGAGNWRINSDGGRRGYQRCI